MMLGTTNIKKKYIKQNCAPSWIICEICYVGYLRQLRHLKEFVILLGILFNR